MRNRNGFWIAAALAVGSLALAAPLIRSQEPSGSLEFTAYVSPTDAKPEPVRNFTFYLLTKSFSDIRGEMELKNGSPDREKFVESLKISPELKAWLKAHDTIDLTAPGTDKLLTTDDIMGVPEFLIAYQRANSGGVTAGLPRPKSRESDKTDHPERYEKEHKAYLAALRKFIQSNPETIAGMELELDEINPARKWAEVQNAYKKRVRQQVPMQAQTKYLAAKVDTNLDGHAVLARLPAGNYWLTSMEMQAGAGDSRLAWDVPVTIQAGQTTRIELTNLNSIEAAKSQ